MPNRSAIQPLAGTNSATENMYAVSATFMCTGSAPNARAMVGSAVAITVLSKFCMNSAAATISDISRSEGSPAAWPDNGTGGACVKRPASSP